MRYLPRLDHCTDQQMHVIGHQDRGVDRTGMLLSGVLQAVQVAGGIRRLTKAGAAVVATWQHMLGDTGKVEAGKACQRTPGLMVERIRCVMIW